jgi:Flp pilus assembly protein TadG
MNASMEALIDRLGRMMRELRTANGANVSVFFALSTVPIIGGVGAAVDYSQANSIKAAMQAAADSTALMLARNIGSGSLTSTDITQKANSYFVALLNRSQAQGVLVTANYTTTGGSEVTVGATASFKTNFTKRFHHADRCQRSCSLGRRVEDAGCARVGQHRLDGRLEQDGLAQDRDALAARSA